jgi:hypothetical protein
LGAEGKEKSRLIKNRRERMRTKRRKGKTLENKTGGKKSNHIEKV